MAYVYVSGQVPLGGGGRESGGGISDNVVR